MNLFSMLASKFFLEKMFQVVVHCPREVKENGENVGLAAITREQKNDDDVVFVAEFVSSFV